MRNLTHRAKRRKFCGEKKSYLTREDACHDLGMLAKVPRAKGEQPMTVYRCRAGCGGFHIGHAPIEIQKRFGLLVLLLFFALPASAQERHWTWNPVHFDKPVLLLSGADSAVAFYDVHKTQSCFPQSCYESNPLAKPIVPHPALAYSLAAGEGYGLGVLGQRMKHSRFRKVWWLPQAAAIGVHFWAIRRTMK